MLRRPWNRLSLIAAPSVSRISSCFSTTRPIRCWTGRAPRPDVTAIARDEDLQRTWRGLVLWNEAGAHVGREVMARQLLNAEHAMNLARAMGFHWLLHIDADELFYMPNGDAPAHFGYVRDGTG